MANYLIGRTQESSQWSQNIVIETGHCQDQLNTRHTINVIFHSQFNIFFTVNNKKREYQQRYRGRNRDKLKQREAERRRRLQNAEIITELSTSSNIEFTELVHEPIIDEISANSQNVAGLKNIQHLFVEVSQQNERGQSSANGTEITNNYSKFRCHQLAHKYFDDKINEYKRLSNKQSSFSRKIPNILLFISPYLFPVENYHFMHVTCTTEFRCFTSNRRPTTPHNFFIT
ncbi:hypothetical protein PV328_001220 [Microctonus aethiopoides]|uniref:Uncharacterized protein n=1 Tax=Microctonus aethiopoides TaxID=144406 RepID=A0AA39FWZ7_9HYME|nr:hypothetical protein PV328_001220 [Microctonus aethiopoides]